MFRRASARNPYFVPPLVLEGSRKVTQGNLAGKVNGQFKRLGYASGKENQQPRREQRGMLDM